jgi:hypothetical protein
MVAVTGGIVNGGIGGGVVGGTTAIARGPQGMAQPVEVVVADADVSGVRIVVKR